MLLDGPKQVALTLQVLGCASPSKCHERARQQGHPAGPWEKLSITCMDSGQTVSRDHGRYLAPGSSGETAARLAQGQDRIPQQQQRPCDREPAGGLYSGSAGLASAAVPAACAFQQV